MSDMIEVECEMCGTVCGLVDPGELRAAIAILNGHLIVCDGERTILSPEDLAEFSRIARENLR